MRQGSARRFEILLLVLAAGLVAVAVRWQVQDQPVPPWLLPVDDAYIFIRYAQQAAAGRPMQWNTGEVSTGATDPAFTALLVPGQWLFDDLPGWSLWSMAVGVLSLAGLGWAATSLTRALLPGGASRLWPLAAGLALIGGGPFGYFSVGGMDNAFSAAVLLAALSRFVSTGGRRGHLWIALLPWVRPDFAVVVAATALVILAGRGDSALPWLRRAVEAARLFVPGVVLMACNAWTTGHVSPGGVLAKSVFSDPFQTPTAALAVMSRQFTEHLLPVYAGMRPTLLPAPVGWLAVCVAVWVLAAARRPLGGEALPSGDGASDDALDSARQRLLLPVLGWLGLVLVATTSGYVGWQRLRHHHPGLALAWIFAFVGLALCIERWSRRRRQSGLPRRSGAAIVLLGLLPWSGLAEVSRDNALSTVSFYGRNFRTAAWLQDYLRQRDPPPVVAVHDAGLLSLTHEVPMVDLMGLGTTDLALPYRDGVGAMVEHLARRARRPELAVGRRALLRLGPLLGDVLYESSPGVETAMVVAPIRSQWLEGTALAAPGIDFGHLPSEASADLHWSPPPPPSAASLGVVIEDTEGRVSAQGCRPLLGRLDIEWDADVPPGRNLVLTFTVARLAAGPRAPQSVVWTVAGETGTADATVDRPGRLVLPVAAQLRLENGGLGRGLDGDLDRRFGAPCLESLAVVDER